MSQLSSNPHIKSERVHVAKLERWFFITENPLSQPVVVDAGLLKSNQSNKVNW